MVPPPPLRRLHRLAALVYSDVGRTFVITVATRPRRPVFDDRVLGACCRDLILALSGGREGGDKPRPYIQRRHSPERH